MQVALDSRLPRMLAVAFGVLQLSCQLRRAGVEVIVIGTQPITDACVLSQFRTLGVEAHFTGEVGGIRRYRATASSGHPSLALSAVEPAGSMRYVIASSVPYERASTWIGPEMSAAMRLTGAVAACASPRSIALNQCFAPLWSNRRCVDWFATMGMTVAEYSATRVR